MLKIIIGLVSLTSLAAFAEEVPRFVCKTRMQIITLDAKYGEIEVTNKRGVSVSSIDGLTVEESALECVNCPTNFLFKDEMEDVATVSLFPSGQITMSWANSSKVLACKIQQR